MTTLRDMIAAYRPDDPLDRAATIPSAWYTDPRIYDLEKEAVLARHWLAVGRGDQVAEPGGFFTTNVGAEPIVLVRGDDGALRGFFNVCQHHAAEVATTPAGKASVLRCPYHGWTYALDGRLRTTPDFDGVQAFDKADHSLSPVQVDTWERFVFVRLAADGPSLEAFLGDMTARTSKLDLSALRFAERKTYDIACNWKVFVDNYLDGGYHVPHIHKGLGSVLSYKDYTIENGERYCVQSSPVDPTGGDADTAAVRGGHMAYYFWLYPNFMLNWYEGYLDTNLVIPIDVGKTRVVFDFYFADGAAGDAATRQSVGVADRVQQEDIDICESVQRGLRSRSYDTGRLCVHREAGEQLFHRLLFSDLTAAVS